MSASKYSRSRLTMSLSSFACSLLLGLVLVLSGCERGPGSVANTPAPTKQKPTLPDAWTTTRNNVSAEEASGGLIQANVPTDDHGNNQATATRLVTDSTLTAGNLTPGDVDFFVITVSESGILNASTTGGTDTIGAILSERNVVHDLDDDSGDGVNFWVSSWVSAGTYYIGVAGYAASTSGYYTLHVSFRGGNPSIAPDDHGDNLITATRVSRSSETGGNLAPSDVDFFAISVNQPGTLTATTFGNTDTFGVLHDQRHALNSDDDSGISYNFWVATPVSAGTYFIEVKGYGDWTAGDYTLIISFSTDSGKPTAVRSVVSSVSVGNARRCIVCPSVARRK